MHESLRRQACLSFHACALGLLAVAAPAQKYAVTPAGYEFHPGNSNNTFPFRGISSRYQQIHDAVDMRSLHGGGVLLMTHIGFRPASTYSIPARTWDVQLTLSATSVTAAQMSTTFSANVTVTNPAVVLPYTTINAPAGKGVGTAVPNQILWSIPFKTPFLYTWAQGNLLWEWQAKNANAYVSSPMDAVSGTTSPAARVGQNSGTGCTATGRTGPAQAQATLGANATLSLVNGPGNAPAMLWVGAVRNTITAGWCTSLYVNPLLALPGMTDSSGAWNAVSVPASSLSATSYWEGFAQFGFADKGLGGFGLSDLAAFSGPANVGNHVSRLWVVSSTNGQENQATGSRGVRFGLVTMFTVK